MHAVLSHNINYVYDSFKYRLYRQLTRFGNTCDAHSFYLICLRCWSLTTWRPSQVLRISNASRSRSGMPYESTHKYGDSQTLYLKAHTAIRLMNAVFGRSASHVWFMAAWSWTVLIFLIVSFSSRSYLSSIQPVKGNQKMCFHGQVEIGRQQNDYETRLK